MLVRVGWMNTQRVPNRGVQKSCKQATIFGTYLLALTLPTNCSINSIILPKCCVPKKMLGNTALRTTRHLHRDVDHFEHLKITNF